MPVREGDEAWMVACAAVAVLACGVSGCQTVAASQGGEVAAVEGRPTSLRPGEFLSVRLPANPSTGYAWFLKPWNGAVLTPATLRMTNRSPGSASKMVWGSIRASEQAMTAVVGC